MANYQPTRGTPRIFELNRGFWLDLAFQVDEDPEVLEHKLTVLQSLGGQVQTQPGVPSNRLRVIMPAMSTEERVRWKLIYDRTLVAGEKIEFVRDSGRFFWLSGDSARDICAGMVPISGSQYSLVTQGGVQGQDRSGAIGVDPADPGTATRTNLVANGDMRDVTAGAPTGWTNNTASALRMAQSLYVLPNGELGSSIEFNALATGTKSAQIDFTLGGYNATTLPGDVLTLSCLIRADVQPNFTPGAALINMDLIVPSSAAVVDWDDFTPTADWTRHIITVDTSAIVPTDTSLRLKLTFSDDLRYLPVSMTELQIEARDFATAFLPYSTVRTSLTGSRDAADLLQYLNALHYRHQLPTWKDSGRWAFTVAFTFTPGWSSGDIPTATITLYQDGDTNDVDTVPALRIHATTSTIVATATGASGTALTATKSGFSFSAGIPVHVLATFQERTGALTNGTLALYVDGTLAESTTHAQRGLRQGKYFWIGSRADGSQTAAGAFSDVAVDPVFMDGTTVPITDYRSATDYSIRPDRNSWRCVLDPSQKGRSDRVNDNQVPLDVALIETVT